MPKDSKKFRKWFVNNRCTICRSELNCGTESALTNHENTKKHQKLLIELSQKAYNTDDEKHSQNSQGTDYCTLLYNSAENILSFYLRPMNYGNLDEAIDGNTKCIVAIKNVIAPYYRELLSREVKSKPFSLIFDEINDTNVTWKLGIIIRYLFIIHKSKFFLVNKKINFYYFLYLFRYYSERYCELATVFLKIVTLPSINAKGIMDALHEIEQEFKLDFKNLVGIGTHNNANMEDINKIVFNALKEKYNLSFFYPILCTSNSLLKAFSNASKTARIPDELEYLIRESYQWFDPLKRIKYQSLYDTINAKQILADKSRINDISWLSMESAIVNIVDNWKQLKNHFNCISKSEQCLTAKSLFRYYDDDRNKIFLLFIKDILLDIVDVNTAFQSSSPDFIKLFKELRDLKSNIHAKASVIPLFQWSIQIQDAIHQYKDKVEGRGENRIRRIRDKILKFVNNFSSELQFFRFYHLTEIENRIGILDFSRNYSDQEMRNGIRQLIENLNITESVITKIERQVMSLRSPDLMNKMNQNFEQQWKFIFSQKNAAGENPYADTCHLLMKYLSLPFSNADVYRIFRQMNEIEMEMLSNEKLDIFNNLLMIKSILTVLKHKYFFLRDLPEDVRSNAVNILFYSSTDNSLEKYILNEEDEDLLVRLNKIENIEK